MTDDGPLDRIRRTAPHAARAPVRKARWWSRFATAGDRVLPDLITIGAQKAGTGSLYSYLAQHPATAPAYLREVHYFDLNFHRGLRWYRAHFARTAELERIREGAGCAVAYEKSPYYLAHPLVPYRIRGVLPQVKLLALLRNPVDRAASHHNHETTLGFETLDLTAALDRELARGDADTQAMLRAPLHESFAHRHLSYLGRGRYAEQLEPWFSLFSRDQILVVDSAELFSDPGRAMSRICEFLEIPARVLPDYRPVGARSYRSMDPEIEARLRTYFAPHNDRLWELIGNDFGWN
jgi:hypothetical protein